VSQEVSFYDKAAPSEWEVGGRIYKMFFTLRAAAKLESLLGKRYDQIVLEMLQVAPDGEDLAPAMSVERQATIVRVLLEEGGTPVPMAELMAMRMMDFSALARAAQAEMLMKQPRGSKKKA